MQYISYSYGTMYSLFMLKMPLNINQPTNLQDDGGGGDDDDDDGGDDDDDDLCGSILRSRRAWMLIIWLHWCLRSYLTIHVSSSALRRRTAKMLHGSSVDLCPRQSCFACF